MRVHYVDQDGEARTAVRDALAGAGATVTLSSTSSDALSALDDGEYDCLVAEHALPDSDAVELLERARAVDPDLPVVVHTAAGSESLAGELVAAGVDGYVPKDEGHGALVERVSAVSGDVAALGKATTPPGGVDGGAAVRPDSRADRLSLLVDQAPLGIVEWDREFRVVGWNPAATAIFGYDREAALGRTAWDLLVPDRVRAGVETVWTRLLEGEEPTHGVNENLRADGSTVTCEWHDTPMTDADGEVVGVLSFVRDVSGEIRRAERLEALQETSRAMMGADTRRAVAETVVAAAEDVLDQPVAGVRLLDEDRDVLETVAMTDRSRELVDDVVEEPPPVGPGDGRVWTAFESGEASVVESLSPDDSVYGEDLPVESLLFQPLGDHGVMVFGAVEPDAFTETEVNMASVLANTATAAMDGAARARELERAETILEAAGDGVFALDTEGRTVQINDRFVQMAGYDRAQLLGAHPSQFLSDADADRAQGLVERLVAGDSESVTYEATIHRPDGSEVPVEVNQSLLPGERFTGVVGTVRDISDRRRMEAAIRERQDKIESLHEVAARLDGCGTEEDIASVAVAAAAEILEFDSCIVALRDGDEFDVKARSGLQPEQVAHRPPVDGTVAGRVLRRGETDVVDDVTADHDAAEIHPEFRSVLTVPLGGRGVLQAISTEFGSYGDSDAELAELLCSHVTNALEQVAFEAELRSERDRMAALFDNVPDPVVSVRHTDGGPVVQSVNSAFEDVFGYAAAEIVGEPLDDYIVPPDDRGDAVSINDRGRQGELVEREVRRRTADGLRDFQLTVLPVDPGERSTATFGIYTDVTERKQRRERVEVLNRVLRHDLRNGMNIIRGSAEQLAESLGGEDAGYARTILDQAEELISLADRTRAVERAFDRGDSSSAPVDVVSLLDRTVSTLTERYPDVDVSTSLPPSAVVRGGSLLELALLDVLENAVVHNDRQMPAVDVDVGVTPDDTVVVTVADDGPGIPETERRLLTGEDEITQLRHASGLGLWLVNWAVTRAGGVLAFDDNEPRGSVVTIRLPRVDDGARQLPVESE